MNIGIVGTGNMGRSLGIVLARQGHNVIFGARDAAKAQAAANLAGNDTQYGSNTEAAAFGDVIVWALRGAPAASIVTDLRLLDGKPIIDLNNNATRTDGGIGPVDSLSAGEKLQAELPDAYVVKAFNTVPMEVFEVAPADLRRHATSVYLASDHVEAKNIVRTLVAQLGFTPIDFGPLRASALLEGISDLVRHAIRNGVPLYSTFSLIPLPQPASHSLGGRAPSKLP